jgi:hypothetical protein
VTSRGIRIWQLFLSVGFAALGIWAFAEAKYISGVIYVVFSVSWLVFAAKGRIGATRERQRARLRS